MSKKKSSIKKASKQQKDMILKYVAQFWRKKFLLINCLENFSMNLNPKMLQNNRKAKKLSKHIRGSLCGEKRFC